MFPCPSRAVRVVVFVVLTVLGSRAAFAQGEEMSFGVRAGMNVSTMEFQSTDVIITPSNRFGLLAGVYTSGRLAGDLGLQVEALFNQKGTIIRDDPRFEGDIDIRIGYLDVPVLLKYRFGWSATKTFEVLAGPVFSVRLNDRQKIGSTVLGDFEKQAFIDSDSGVSVGGAMSFDRLSIDVRYIWGWLNINDDFDRDELAARNRALSVSVGWRLR